MWGYQKINFCLCMIGKSYLLHHIILTIADKNLIPKTTRILQIQCFFKVNRVPIFSGKLKFCRASTHLITLCLTCKLSKKLLNLLTVKPALEKHLSEEADGA